jgi:hypothetical protein
MFSVLIDHPKPVPAQTCDSWHKRSSCDKKDASVQSGLTQRGAPSPNRPGDRVSDESNDEALFTKIADLTRKTRFSGISGLKEALSQRKCVVRLHPEIDAHWCAL